MKEEELLAELTLEEKIRLLAGKSYWFTADIERLGIPSMHLSDGPSGVRGARTVGTRSVSFPCGVAIGATFDPEAAAKLGAALADECIDKGVHVLLGPTINLQRHPLGGRHFECYSEDPVLTADLAVAYVTALQERGISATVKHYIANDTEYDRHRISSELSDDTLRRLYAVPFEAAVKEAGAWAIMSSYNRINGTYAAENPELLEGVLRGEWGFDGLVMSDWFGAQSTAPSANAGLDLEMPGPPIHYGTKLEEAVADDLVSEATITERARRVLQLATRTGVLADQPAERKAALSVDARRDLARHLAARSIVLLENDGLLPLALEAGDVLAVIGPNARSTATQGGGSAQVHPDATVSVLDGLRAVLEPAGVEVVHELGCVTWADTPALGLHVEIEYSATAGGEILYRESHPNFPLLWLGDPVPGVDGLSYGAFSVRCTTHLTAEEDGSHELVLAQAGSARVLLDGEVVVEGSSEKGKRFFGFGSAEATGACELAAGTSYELVVEYDVAAGSPVAGVFLGLRPPVRDDVELIVRATELATRAAAVVCVVGTTAEWETEGHDRLGMDLPGRQDDLVRAVAAANPRTVVVLNTGSPVTMEWAEEPAAVLATWFGGERMGDAVAAVLTGVEEPVGRLPHTIPVRLEDTPAFPYYPGEEGRASYGEGEHIGYRHYAKSGVAPRYWFGHGLSYSSFEVGGAGSAELDTSGALRVMAPIKNTGPRQATALLQAYLAPTGPGEDDPVLRYAGSARLRLEGGATGGATAEIPATRLVHLRPGAYRVLVGLSADPAALVAVGEVAIG